MGYTHYWTQTRDLTEDEFIDVGVTVMKIVREATGKSSHSAGGFHAGTPVKICGGDGHGKPEIGGDVISLNGEGVLGHETFYLNRVIPEMESWQTLEMKGWNFCKTARKPYDLVVTAVLAYLGAYYDYEVSSDGDLNDWVAGTELANKVVGKPVPNPMIVADHVA